MNVLNSVKKLLVLKYYIFFPLETFLVQNTTTLMVYVEFKYMYRKTSLIKIYKTSNVHQEYLSHKKISQNVFDKSRMWT